MMKTPPLPYSSSIRLHIALFALLLSLLTSSAAAQIASGRITGVVTNSNESVFIEGATVTIDGTNRVRSTDRRGEFDFGEMPPGEYKLYISYTGMTPGSARAVIVSGQSANISVILREDVIKMGTFSVTADRSADALAITEQRNSPNVKNVVDIQSYGMLNNDNPAELLQLLPGVTGSLFFNEVDRVSVRGIDSSLNNVQLDGGRKRVMFCGLGLTM